jgi:hypothetical protein
MQLASSRHRRASFTSRWAIKTSLVVPPGGRCSRRARSLPGWHGPCLSSRASEPRRSPGVRLRACRTATTVRIQALCAVPASVTRVPTCAVLAPRALASAGSALVRSAAARAVQGSDASFLGSEPRSGSASPTSNALTQRHRGYGVRISRQGGISPGDCRAHTQSPRDPRHAAASMSAGDGSFRSAGT